MCLWHLESAKIVAFVFFQKFLVEIQDVEEIFFVYISYVNFIIILCIATNFLVSTVSNVRCL